MSIKTLFMRFIAMCCGSACLGLGIGSMVVWLVKAFFYEKGPTTSIDDISNTGGIMLIGIAGVIYAILSLKKDK